MLEITCKGSPFEIGQQHGHAARTQVRGSMKFYEYLFLTASKLNWPQVLTEAVKFLPMLEASWMPLVEEMRGVADGAGVDFESILALNVRTEIAYGMFNDGCTALSWKHGDASFIAQNWDWEEEQTPNLLSMHIVRSDEPSIHMMTEAGIIGKIGLNSSGVGVTLNAIKAKGVDFNRLPCHLALRTALNSTSRVAAVTKLHQSGVASSCHILVADVTGGLGLECSAYDIVELPMTNDGIVTHTNHFLVPHAGPKAKVFLEDTIFRLDRVRELLKPVAHDEPRVTSICEILKDEKSYPGSICRGPTEKSTIETLFSIVMDLGHRTARVQMGRPTEGGQVLTLSP